MLTRWTLENFKPIRERLDLPLAPLTVLAGLNSSGKSSFLQSILLIAQTLANQKLDEPLVLNGTLIRLGTFADVCNDRAHHSRIGIGFIFGSAAQSISMQSQFEAVSPNAGEVMPIAATRTVLDSVKMAVGDPASLTVDVKRASQAEETAFVSGIKDSRLARMPYGPGQNYIARIQSTGSQPVVTFTELAHMIPRRHVRRLDLVELFREITAEVIRRLTPDLADEPKRAFQVSLADQMRDHGVCNSDDIIEDGVRGAINKIATELPVAPLIGTKVGDLIEWLTGLPEAIRARDDLRDRLAMTILKLKPSAEMLTLFAAPEAIALDLEPTAQRIINAFISGIRYLGPLRADPHAVQSYSPSGQPDDVGPRGEYAAAVYSSNRKQSLRWWNPFSRQIDTTALEDAMDAWLRYLGIADHVSTREAAVPGPSWMVRPTATTRERPLQAVGVGVSQVLPILVSGLLAPEGTILIMEQPELHLHERPQARLGDFFYGLTRVGKQVLVETHSAVLINQLRYLMVKGDQEVRDAIAIYFVEQDEQGDARFQPIRISKGGAVENWPDGFFDESFRQEDRITEEGIRARGKRESA
jgi:predicted ATPase